MYHFIVNPNSRTGLGLKIWKQAEEELKKRKVEYHCFFTEYRGHARLLAKESSKNATAQTPVVLVAIGGDGTINEVLNGIKDSTHLTLGYIPTGSGNDFARGMKIPTATQEAIDLIIGDHEIIFLDIATVTYQDRQRRFGISTGLGFDALICHKALKSRLKKFLNFIKLGKLTYAIIAVTQLIHYKPGPMDITLDDGRKLHFDHVFFATAMTQKYEGGGLMLCPEADPSDQILDVFIVADLSKIKILFMLPTAFKGHHVHIKGVHIYQSTTMKVESLDTLPLHLDGESGGFVNTFSCEYIKEPLSVISCRQR